MFGPIRWRARWSILNVTLLAFLAIGCNQSSPDSNQDQPAIRSGDGLSGSEILHRLLERYTSAASYSDRAVLSLSYRLDGQPIHEPQPWSVRWDSKNQQLSGQIYNCQIRCDGRRLSCFVYDIDTGNLDNQQLVIPMAAGDQVPVASLLADPIACHFLSGYSELPLDERTDEPTTTVLVPTTIGLLTNQVPADWLRAPLRVVRLADESIDQRACYVIQNEVIGGAYRIWVDRQSLTVLQISFPTECLHQQILTATEISDLRLVARFHEARLDAAIDANDFAVNLQPSATPVAKFVALPDPFPSELIGQPAPGIHLLSPDGRQVDQLHFDAKITALLWISGNDVVTAIQQFQQLAAELGDPVELAVIYSDDQLAQPGSGSFRMSPDLETFLSESNLSIPFYCDPALETAGKLRLNAIPAVLVMDGDSKIQFVQSLMDRDWPAKLAAAVKRVTNGEDIANEMLAEYGGFLNAYHQRLTEVNAAKLLEKSSPELDEVKSGAVRDSQTRLQLTRGWTNSEFKQAGNLAVVEDGAQTRIVALDGWRTVVLLDAQGRTTERHELDLPEDQAATLIRVLAKSAVSSRDADGPQSNQNSAHSVYSRLAVFSPLSPQVFLCDDRGRLISAYPPDAAMRKVRDCVFNESKGGHLELLVAFDDPTNGIQQFDLDSGKTATVADWPAESMASLEDQCFVASEGKLLVRHLNTSVQDLPQDSTDLSTWYFRRLIALVGGSLADALNADDSMAVVCGIAMNPDGQWQAIGLDAALRQKWSVPIGSQLFESQLQPAAVASDSRMTLLAIADVDNNVQLISAAGISIGTLHMERELRGLGLRVAAGRPQILLATNAGIECWDVNVPNDGPFRQASGQPLTGQ